MPVFLYWFFLTKYIKGVYYEIAERWSFGFVLFISPLRIG